MSLRGPSGAFDVPPCICLRDLVWNCGGRTVALNHRHVRYVAEVVVVVAAAAVVDCVSFALEVVAAAAVAILVVVMVVV
jgi:hypothetical protein